MWMLLSEWKWNKNVFVSHENADRVHHCDSGCQYPVEKETYLRDVNKPLFSAIPGFAVWT